MKIVQVIGGLGNQMFQYAFYLFLKGKGTDVKLDFSSYEKYGLHNGLELDAIFKIIDPADIATNQEIKSYKDLNPFFKIRKTLNKVLFRQSGLLIKRTHWVEPKFSHFYNDIDRTRQIFLDGYWQNEKYLKPNELLIRQLYVWNSIDQKNITLAAKTRQEESVSVHIRRLDRARNFSQLFYYLRLKLVWRTALKEYYLQAIDFANNNIKNPEFYIFTDNVAWVKEHFPSGSNFTIVDWNRGENSHQDMFLMSQCKHNIISMSSFSWWGAWLNANPDKIVIAPKKWAPRFVPADEIIPDQWIRL